MVFGYYLDCGFIDVFGGVVLQEEMFACLEDVFEWMKEDFVSVRVECDQNLLNVILEIEEK